MKKTDLIPSLNGLRALSIMMVIGFHFQLGGVFTTNNELLKLGSYFFLNGPLGVNVFFVISGFLITTLLLHERNKTGKVSLKNFYIRRSFRIFPAYYFLLFVYLILQFENYLHLSMANWLSVIFYQKQFVPSASLEINHLWSLSVEEIFYLIYPAIFIIFYSNMPKVILGSIAGFVIIRFCFYQFPTPVINNTIFNTGDSILVGCLLAFKKEAIHAYIIKNPNISLLAFPLLIFSVLIYSFIYWIAFKSSNTNFSLLFQIAQRFIYTFFGSIGIVSNLLIGYIVIISINIKNIWFKFLNTSVLNYIGLLSYSIYLWQQLFTADRESMNKLPILLRILCIIILALISYYFIEKPFLKLRKKFSFTAAA